ncbi:MFS transporter [Mycetocola reblochoni]|uniref:Major facilitator family transporter n=2 Tax=Mycetocola reblochoni TaxID=331618 RepID=A0A1R4KBU1_9MICO|nr:MFS transporter [Mycetocola reblochoni]RLP69247.1 MFS transporter [Mycetocola reblochoni]SJN41625.1 Major facilitator family transporter [Mycetocola reblochoni REB411]
MTTPLSSSSAASANGQGTAPLPDAAARRLPRATASSGGDPSGPARPDGRFPLAGLVVLSVAVFLSITAETLPMGLLPQMSADLAVTESQVGLLVTVFAFTVVVTATPVMALTSRVARRRLLLAVVVVLGLANGVTALLPDYGWIVAVRVLGGMAHGVFWSLVAAYAARLVTPERIGTAVSITLAGGSMAFVAGVPVATFAGQLVGWRWVFAVIGVLLLACAVLIVLVLPPVAATPRAATDTAGDRGAPRDRTLLPVLVLCAGVAAAIVGHYVLYTYIVPFLTAELGVPDSQISLWLLGYGVAGLLGLALSGTVLARRPLRGIVVVAAAMALGLVVLATGLGGTLGTVLAFGLWAVGFGALPPMLQTRMLTTSSDAMRDIASAFYTSAFNIGIGGGALVGSLILAGGGLAALPWSYLLLLLIGVGCVVVSAVLAARRRA